MNDSQFFEFERQDNLRQERLDRIADLHCSTCKRYLVPGEIFSNGYRDNKVTCHACQQARNHALEAELLAGEEEVECTGNLFCD